MRIGRHLTNFLDRIIVIREVAIQKPAQTPLSYCSGIVREPTHREVNARTYGYPCQMDSVQSLYGMTG